MDYITIIQGDDTNFLDDQFIVVNFDTDLDLSGFTATFTLGDVTLTYGNLSNKTFEIVLSNEITSNLVIGKQYGELKLLDPQNRIRTITSIIPFIVKNGVNEDITFVKNSLHVSMNVYDTTIDIYVETSGISKTEASRLITSCNDAKQAAQSYSNTAQNSLIDINKSISDFNNSLVDLNTLLDDATEQANIAIQKAAEVDTILENASDSDLSKLSQIGLDRINQSKGIETGNISNDTKIYNKILEYKQNAIRTGVEVLEENYSIVGDTLTVANGITNGLVNSSDYIKIQASLPPSKANFHIHIEAIAKESSNNTNYYFCTSSSAFCIQGNYNGSVLIYFYDANYSTYMAQTQACPFNAGDRIIIDSGYDLETEKIYVRVTCGENSSYAEDSIGSAWFRSNASSLWLGKNSYSYSCYAEIDLTKSYLETSSGIYRFLVSIPYSLTKTGAKIVDASNRNLIQDIYQQEGMANYYTIDEENHNFTLPMGNLYGMLSKTKDKLANKTLDNVNEFSDRFAEKILDLFTPENLKSITLSSVPQMTSQYTTPCAGWYVVFAEPNANSKNYLYIDGFDSGIGIGGTSSNTANQSSISIFVGKGTSLCWGSNFKTVWTNKFIPAKGAKYSNSSHEGVLDDLEDLFG